MKSGFFLVLARIWSALTLRLFLPITKMRIHFAAPSRKQKGRDNMAFSPGYVKETLVSSIQDMMKLHPELFGYDPSTSRNRKLPIETVVRLLISMNGGSLAKELRQVGINATPSAFVQRRKAIDPQGMREIFRDFNRFPLTLYMAITGYMP